MYPAAMQTITLVGAGGKMGCRITDNLRKTSYPVHYLEVSAAGIERLLQRGITTSIAEEAIPTSDVVILAVPDVAIESVSRSVTSLMKPGALLMTLDPAAPLDGKVALKKEIAVVVAHPCHPSIFNWEPTEEGFRDFYGGISAKQGVVLSLIQGSESDAVLGEEIARAIYEPVSRVYRMTLEQMAILEPAMVETLAQTCMEVIHEGYRNIVARGVPEEAARDFVLGHLRIQIAVLFQEVQGTFSDAAYKISRRARPILFQPGWERIFELDDIREQVRDITTIEPALCAE